MTKPTIFRLALAASVLAVPLLVASSANPRRKPVRLAAVPKLPNPVAPPHARDVSRPASAVKLQTDLSKLPQYLSLAQIKRIQARRKQVGMDEAPPALVPYWQGHALKVPMHDLLSGPSLDSPSKAKKVLGAKEYSRFAQAFPRPVPPAGVRRSSVRPNIVPKWVRYPLEFQLCGIGLGTRAVDKDRFNRIDRYGLFALHGNPTAVVRAVGAGGGGGGAAAGGGDAGGGAPAGGDGGTATLSRGGLGGVGAAPGGGGAAAGGGGSNITLQQTPPELAGLFPGADQGGTPSWALAITVQLDNNHVEWLYNRGTYAMGFVVDRLGFVDAVIVAGIRSDIARTQLEDPVHTVKLGDDLRKVLFRYGYPDDLVPLGSESVASASAGTGDIGGGPAPGGGLSPSANAALGTASSGGAGGDGGGTAAPGGGGGSTNSAYRTFDLRYEQSYNVVFTIRNNRVVRVYIFGDPDFFNAQRRNLLRARY